MYVPNQSDIIANLKATAKALQGDEQALLNEIGQRGVNYLKINTPVDTGRLRASMSFTVGSNVEAPLNPFESNDSVRSIGDKKIVAIGTNVKYAEKVEYMGRGASKGFMARSYRQLKKEVEVIAKSFYQARGY